MNPIVSNSRRADEPVISNPGPAARRVLVVCGGRLGDFMASLGAIKAIRRFHPRARVILLTDPAYVAFAQKCPFVDAVQEVGALEGPKEQRELGLRLASERFDMVYDLEGPAEGSPLNTALRAFKPRPAWNGPADAVTPEGAARDVLSRLQRQLQAAGVEASEVDFDWIRPANGDPPRLRPAYFGLNGPFALIAPGSAPERAHERWPAASYGKLARAIAEHGVTPVIIGAKAEADLVPVILRECREAINLVTRTDLFQLACLAQGASFGVGNVSGPMAVVLLAGRPAVVICKSGGGAGLPDWSQRHDLVRVHASDIAQIPVHRERPGATGVLDLIDAIGGFPSPPVAA
jgi:ADP-heptose:LPS heptosyltransferase